MMEWITGLAGYLSSDELEHDLLEDFKDLSNYDPIADLRGRLKEPFKRGNYIAICCNVMYEIEKDMGKRDIEICVAVLNSIKELEELQPYHEATVTKLYELVDNRKLDLFRKRNMCVIL